MSNVIQGSRREDMMRSQPQGLTSTQILGADSLSLLLLLWQERRAQAIREGGLVTYKDQLSYGLHIVVVLAVFYALGYLAASRISPKPTLVSFHA